ERARNDRRDNKGEDIKNPPHCCWRMRRKSLVCHLLERTRTISDELSTAYRKPHHHSAPPAIRRRRSETFKSTRPSWYAAFQIRPLLASTGRPSGPTIS